MRWVTGADVLLQVVAAQKDHLRQLEALREALNAAQGDVALPVEVEKSTPATRGRRGRRCCSGPPTIQAQQAPEILP